MKVLIVGAGIGGLSAYLALKKYVSPLIPSLSVRIVEVHAASSLVSPTTTTTSPLASTSTIVGAGLGLAPNGLRAINSLSPGAARYILDRAFVDGAGRVTFRNAGGGTLGVFVNGRGERYGGFGMVMVRRVVVFEALLKAFEEFGGGGGGGDGGGRGGEKVEWGRKVVGVREVSEGGGVEVEYGDGLKEIVDLVIGADGVRSRVRDLLFGGRYAAEYDGLTSAGSFIPLSLLPLSLRESLMKEGKDDEGVVMTFGSQGFFGYSLCTPRFTSPSEINQSQTAEQRQQQYSPILQWWAIYEVPEPGYTSARAKTPKDADGVKQELLKMYGSWKSPRDETETSAGAGADEVFKSIIELGCTPEEIAETLTYHHTPLLLLPRYIVPRRLESYTTPTKTGRIVLLGDAAHAMPPDAGQGVSCAVEDAVVYALLFGEFIAHGRGVDNKGADGMECALRNVAVAYDELRMPRVGKILDFAKYNGDSKKRKGKLASWFRDLGIRILCKMPESINDSLFGYDPEKAVEDYPAKQRKK
ncbi:hypothetical protein AX17_003704 [Amanita inopinata Kibby_2008]|nr:hypothetical protein AX17_003704 [Amanita inopinata Kibby_2008]